MVELTSRHSAADFVGLYLDLFRRHWRTDRLFQFDHMDFPRDGNGGLVPSPQNSAKRPPALQGNWKFAFSNSAYLHIESREIPGTALGSDRCLGRRLLFDNCSDCNGPRRRIFVLGSCIRARIHSLHSLRLLQILVRVSR